MSACGREFHNACKRIKSSYFEAAGRGSRARRRLKKSHMCSIGDISGEQADQGRSCMSWAAQKSRTVCSMWAGIILQKESSWDALKEGNDFEL
ncbi:uncharacterized protein TNCV_2321411 [Trichonephila clavipes]|nr:uncharacterized protein TNCV_2321411 [Trichonephila clavipes]